MNPVVIVVSVVIWGAIGIVATWWPQSVQRWAIRSQRGWAGRVNPFRGFIESDAYVPTVRVIGLVCLAAAVFMLASVTLGVGGPTW
jgi:hypothetical protein